MHLKWEISQCVSVKHKGNDIHIILYLKCLIFMHAPSIISTLTRIYQVLALHKLTASCFVGYSAIMWILHFPKIKCNIFVTDTRKLWLGNPAIPTPRHDNLIQYWFLRLAVYRFTWGLLNLSCKHAEFGSIHLNGKRNLTRRCGTYIQWNITQP